MHTAVKVGLVGCGAIVLIGVVGIGGLFVWLASGPESGVKLANEMDDYALRHLDEHDILEPGEELLAYYDVTIRMDGSEAALVTDRRVVYHNRGVTTAFPLAEVEDVAHVEDPIAGDVFTVRTESGGFMKIEVALWNGGDTFARVLNDAWRRQRDAAAQPDSPASGTP